MASTIEDYALIGDCESAALVGRDGSVDWLCWPRFDSAACFANLVGDRDNGHWRIAPEVPPKKTERRYRDGTLILETDFVCDSGTLRLIDFMPPRDGFSNLVRLATCIDGEVAVRSELRIRFDYGAVVPWVTRLDDGSLRAIAGPDMLVLRTSAPNEGVDHMTESRFTIRKGDTVPFVLTYAPSHQPPPPPVDLAAQLDNTERFWRDWSSRCVGAGPHTAAIRRSLITLKALTYAPTGGIVAAVTTSLPELIGGSRNWDYRFCWLRDASFALDVLLSVGYTDEAVAFRNWLMRAAANSPDHVQIMYGLGGERRLAEVELPWLGGYEGSKPVRIGNAASLQFQLDVYGEITEAMANAIAAGAPGDPMGFQLQLRLMRHLETVWREPDYGIWEVRGAPQHFTYSKVMTWVAFDRTLQGCERLQTRDAPLERWRRTRDEIHADICAKAWNEELGAFTQAYGSNLLDASVLRMAHVGFLPATDPRLVSTVRAIEKKLTTGGFVHRYDTGRVDDGLNQDEGVFLACSFWLADNYIMQGRIHEGRALFTRLLGLCNDVGLLAEEYDPHAKRQLGNFPQAFSHVALVSCALRLQQHDENQRS